MKEINFYADLGIWPYLLLFLGIWKGLDIAVSCTMRQSWELIQPTTKQRQWTEPAKWQRIRNVTIPQLTPLVTVLTILAVGNIFPCRLRSFLPNPHNAGQLYNVTNVLDVYVYNGLTQTADIGMASAAGLYQSVVGFAFGYPIKLTCKTS